MRIYKYSANTIAYSVCYSVLYIVYILISMCMVDIMRLNALVTELADSIPKKYTSDLNIPPGSKGQGLYNSELAVEEFNIHTVVLSMGFMDSYRVDLLNSIHNQFGYSYGSQFGTVLGARSHTQYTLSEITGSLNTHVDLLASGPVRALVLLSDSVVSVTQDGIPTLYTRGDTLLLDTSNPHDAVIVSGDNPQRWLVCEQFCSSGTYTDAYFLNNCLYTPARFRNGPHREGASFHSHLLKVPSACPTCNLFALV